MSLDGIIHVFCDFATLSLVSSSSFKILVFNHLAIIIFWIRVINYNVNWQLQV